MGSGANSFHNRMDVLGNKLREKEIRIPINMTAGGRYDRDKLPESSSDFQWKSQHFLQQYFLLDLCCFNHICSSCDCTR